jgi:opacity protein-like surface antigen
VTPLPAVDYVPGYHFDLFSTTYKDEIHLISFAPEFKWPITHRLKLAFSPELNWVMDHGETLVSTTNPLIDIVLPRRVKNEQELTIGASAGVAWSLTDSVALAVRYKYVDLKPSRGREAHVVSSSIRWSF